MLGECYEDLMSRSDFQYFYKFRKTDSNFQDLWRMKSAARESLREWLLSIRTEPAMAEVISNASSELVENCIKYSKIGTYSFVLISVVNRDVRVETINSAETEQREKVRSFIRDINSGRKGLTELYIERLTESASSGKSQLGFIKLLMETKGRIEIDESPDRDEIVALRVSIEV